MRDGVGRELDLASVLHVAQRAELPVDDRDEARAERVRVPEGAFDAAPREIHLRAQAG